MSRRNVYSVLIKPGADPNVKVSRGNTALYHAVSMGNTSMTAKLLAYKANKDEKSKV
jgi:ankyrin repeat protein